MSAPTGSQTVTYRKPGVVPPVYLAGSFTDPQWQPREMQHTRGADDEYVFTSSVQGAPGKEYQYKFRIGQADQWVIDDTVPACESSRHPSIPTALPGLLGLGQPHQS